VIRISVLINQLADSAVTLTGNDTNKVFLSDYHYPSWKKSIQIYTRSWFAVGHANHSLQRHDPSLKPWYQTTRYQRASRLVCICCYVTGIIDGLTSDNYVDRPQQAVLPWRPHPTTFHRISPNVRNALFFHPLCKSSLQPHFNTYVTQQGLDPDIKTRWLASPRRTRTSTTHMKISAMWRADMKRISAIRV
jgi:hypothetical protein